MYYTPLFLLPPCLFIWHYRKDNPASTFDHLDLPFVLHTLNIILVQCDNTIVQMRVLVFIYSQFSSLTESHPDLMAMLCNRILLHPFVFERYLTHWHSGVRVIFLQCLFWRLRPLWSSAAVPWKPTPVSSTQRECNGKYCWHMWQVEHPGKSNTLLSHIDIDTCCYRLQCQSWAFQKVSLIPFVCNTAW